MNILITGANGQLGRTFADVSAGGEHKCFFTDVREGEGVDRLDVTDFDAVMSYFETSGAEVIVNCAAYTNVDGAESDEEAARLVNIEAPKVLAEAATKLMEAGMINDNGLVICESDDAEPIEAEGYRVRRHARYGRIYITVLEKDNGSEDAQ